jgi:hypothetical protein
VDRYVLPKIGGMPVDRIGDAAVNEVLRFSRSRASTRR